MFSMGARVTIALLFSGANAAPALLADSGPYGRIPARLEFAFISGWEGSDGRMMSYNYSGVTWPDPSYGQLQVRTSNFPYPNPTDHYFLGEEDGFFGLEWNAASAGVKLQPKCKPFAEVMPAAKSTAMSFGLISPLPATLVNAPKFINAVNWGRHTTGPPCYHVAKLTSRCGGGPCWHLPGRPKEDLFMADTCAGVGGPRGVDWCAVTDLCFSENSADPASLPRWESLVGISFSHGNVTFPPDSTLPGGSFEGFIPVKDVVVADVAAPLPGVCGQKWGAPIINF